MLDNSDIFFVLFFFQICLLIIFLSSFPHPNPTIVIQCASLTVEDRNVL